jgi:S-adenosylmethionine hydrolase
VVGPPTDAAVELTWPEPERTGDTVVGEVIYVDGFGNLVTNVSRSALLPGRLAIHVGDRPIGPLQRTYADVASGEPVAVMGSWDLVEVAVRDASAADALGAGPGTPIRIACT